MIELFQEALWIPNHGTKNVQLIEINQDMCNSEGSDNIFNRADLWTNPPPSFLEYGVTEK
jgi:hypothetical protein